MSTRTEVAKFNDLPADYAGLVAFHPPRPIHDEAELEAVLALVDAMAIRSDLTADQQDYLDILSTMVERYEAEHHTFGEGEPSAEAALRALLDEHGMTASDLGRLLGERSLGSRILRGERQLSKAHIRLLTDRFKVSADLFI